MSAQYITVDLNERDNSDVLMATHHSSITIGGQNQRDPLNCLISDSNENGLNTIHFLRNSKKKCKLQLLIKDK